MKHNLFCFLFLISVSLFYYAPNTTASPIIHGVPADQRFWKFHVSIHKMREPQNVYRYACGGSIISEKHILTAGHCFVVQKQNDVIEEFFYPCGKAKIIAGANQKDGPGIERDIMKVFIPSGSNPRLLTVDLAIAQLNENLDVHHHEWLAIMPYGALDPETIADVHRRARFCGFGHNVLEERPNGRTAPAYSGTINRFMNVIILSRNECGLASARGICTRNADPRDTFRTACSGDSGAGLIYGNKIVGVLSQGPYNCDTSDPIVFERLYGNMRFISEALNPIGYYNNMHILEHQRGTACNIS